jgi:hypothetical protein
MRAAYEGLSGDRELSGSYICTSSDLAPWPHICCGCRGMWCWIAMHGKALRAGLISDTNTSAVGLAVDDEHCGLLLDRPRCPCHSCTRSCRPMAMAMHYHGLLALLMTSDSHQEVIACNSEGLVISIWTVVKLSNEWRATGLFLATCVPRLASASCLRCPHAHGGMAGMAGGPQGQHGHNLGGIPTCKITALYSMAHCAHVFACCCEHSKPY